VPSGLTEHSKQAREPAYSDQMLPPWTLLIASHAVAASLALVLGAFQIMRRTKGDLTHRIVGRTWVVLMLYVSAGSFFFGGYDQAVAVFLRLLATWTLASVTVGVFMARRGNIRRHRGLMVGNYIGLLAALVGVLAVHTRRVPSWFVAHPVGMSLVAVAIAAVAGFFLAAVVTYALRSPATHALRGGQDAQDA
jgi:uncharacterized membrane protein